MYYSKKYYFIYYWCKCYKDPEHSRFLRKNELRSVKYLIYFSTKICGFMDCLDNVWSWWKSLWLQKLFWQRIFSVKNQGKYKVLRFLGIKISLRRKISVYKEIISCRICSSANIETVISLGKQCLTGVFPPPLPFFDHLKKSFFRTA